MKYFITSDVHSYYTKLQEKLTSLSFNKEEDTLVLLGDAFDRGPETIALYDWLRSLPNIIYVLGNHDQMTIDFLENPHYEKASFNAYRNGNKYTLMHFAGINETEFDQWIEDEPTRIRDKILVRYPELLHYLKKLPLWFETEDEIFIHSGLDLTIDDWHMSSFKSVCWNREFFWQDTTEIKKTIYLGHTPTKNLREIYNKKGNNLPLTNEPFAFENKIAMDGGVCYPEGQINVLILEK